MASAGHLAVIGGGIVGVALAERLSRDPAVHVVVVEKEPELASHQSGHNSGVVHMGVYYPPGSLKARLCRRGSELLKEFCTGQDIAYDEVGKVVVAVDERELPALNRLYERSLQNGVPDVAIIDGGALTAIEPLVRGTAALHSPRSAIVDFPTVTRRLAAAAAERGTDVRLNFPVRSVRQSGESVTLAGPSGQLTVDRVVVCAGLQADRVAHLAGDERVPAIVPFLGEYYVLAPELADSVRGLVYPVPDPRYPFLGIHLTRRLDGTVWVGPNALLALAREGYRKSRVDRTDLTDLLRFPGLWRMGRRNWRAGGRELVVASSRALFARAARRYVPTLRAADLTRGPVGVRAQAVDADGVLVDDFRLSRHGRVVSVRNAPSPGATSALALAEHLVAEIV
jgi:L-2-hydroxyglutarate oxidase LhgO